MPKPNQVSADVIFNKKTNQIMNKQQQQQAETSVSQEATEAASTINAMPIMSASLVHPTPLSS